MKTLVLDLETQQLVKDWAKPWEAGLSVCGVWISWMGGPAGRFRLYDPGSIHNVIPLIEAAEVVVTYNGDKFDLPFLGGLVRAFKVRKHIDLLALIKAETGRRWSLDNITRATLGRCKTGKGSSAPLLWSRNEFASLYSYCLDDVALTRDLYKFALTHGYVLGDSDEGIQQIELPLGAKRMNHERERENHRTAPHHARTSRQHHEIRKVS